MAEIKRAIEAFAFTGKDGVPRVVTPGFLMSTDDVDYKGKESLFESVEVAAARPGVQAAGDSELAHFPSQEWIDALPDVAAQPDAKPVKRRLGRRA
jgi:hypothetical protein